jgi:hypothetical protein
MEEQQIDVISLERPQAALQAAPCSPGIVAAPVVEKATRCRRMSARLFADRGLRLEHAANGPLRICHTSRGQRRPYAEFCRNRDF